jgi:AraC family transcriptional regulator
MDPIEGINIETYSSDSRWDDILVQEFRLSKGELPEAQRDNHHITVNLGTLGWAEHLANGAWQETAYPTGAIGFVPAGHVHKPKWNFNSRVVTLSIVSQQIPGLNLKEQRGVIDQEVSFIAALLAAELRYRDKGSNLLAESSALTLQNLLQQKYGSGPGYNKVVFSKLSGSQLANVIEYCMSYIDQNIQLKELAGICHLSSFHFARQFKKTVGLSPYQYLMSLRIDRAKQMLSEKETTMTEISAKLGYADHSHFSRAFKQSTGATPSEFRFALHY